MLRVPSSPIAAPAAGRRSRPLPLRLEARRIYYSLQEGPQAIAAPSNNLTFEISESCGRILDRSGPQSSSVADWHSLHLASLALLAGRLQQLPEGVRRLLAGGLAGAVGKTATAPLEAVKLQLVQGRMGVWEAALLIYHRNGLGGFFRGNGLDVLRTVPAKGIELATFDLLKKSLVNAAHSRKLPISDGLIAGASGASAGVLATIAVHPLETVRTRLVVGGGRGGALACAADIIRQEGAGALFRGLDASIVGIVPYAAIRLATYDGLKQAYKNATKHEHLSPHAALLFGAAAGVVSAVVTFPLEVVRRRMMAGGAHGNLGAALVGIMRQEGPGALFNGVWLTVLKQAPQYALGFASYEQAKRALAL